jgi:4-oxalocrotonate tautomerase
MPVVIVKLYEGRTVEQKRAAAQAITQVVVETLKTTPEATHVIFEDVKKSDWAIAGKLASES